MTSQPASAGFFMVGARVKCWGIVFCWCDVVIKHDADVNLPAMIRNGCCDGE